MSKVISDALQQIVRASQLGEVIVSVKRPLIPTTAIFTVILNIDVATTIITLLCTTTGAIEGVDQNNSPGVTSMALFTSGVDITVAIDGSFVIEAVPAFTFVATPDQENLLSNTGSSPALDAAPLFDVT